MKTIALLRFLKGGPAPFSLSAASSFPRGNDRSGSAQGVAFIGAPSARACAILLTLGCTLALGLGSARATSLYWDDNGTTAGASSTPTGTWGTSSFWNSDSTGVANTFTAITTSSDAVFFVAGPSATSGNSDFTVSLSADQATSGITFQSSATNITLGADSTRTISVGAGGITMASTAYSGVNAGGATINANIALTANQTFSAPRAPGLTFNGVISGAFNLTLSGNGTKTLNAANTYTGTTTISNSSVVLGGTAGSFGTGDVNISDAFGGISFTQSSNVTFANNITGAGSSAAVTKSGSTTTLTLTGTNTYTGGTLIRGNGAISVGSITNNLGSGNIKMGSSGESGTLIYTGAGETTTKTIQLTGSSGGGTIQADGTGALVVSNGIAGATSSGSRTLTLRGANTGANSIGAITNGTATTLGVSKTDAGKWILTGTNTYSGTTAVSAGTLLINGDNSAATGAVSVSSGATFGGSGTIGGATTAASGSFLSAGSASGTAGTLTFNSTLNVSGLAAGTGGLLFDLGATGASDKIVSGALTIGSGVLNFNDFSFTTLSGFGGGTYTLFSATSIVGTLGSSLSGTVDGLNGVLSQSGNDLILTVTAIPEPSTYALFSGMLVLGGMICRRRRQPKV
jgi:autotransporter-associated beta strand protein